VWTPNDDVAYRGNPALLCRPFQKYLPSRLYQSFRRHLDGDALSNLAGFSYADAQSERQRRRTDRRICPGDTEHCPGLCRNAVRQTAKAKPIALVGYFLAAIGKPLMGLATIWQVVFGARLLDRFYYGAAFAVVGAFALWLFIHEMQDRRVHRAA
jgi:hypothetical protein